MHAVPARGRHVSAEQLRLGSEMSLVREPVAVQLSPPPKMARPRFRARYKGTVLQREAVHKPQGFEYVFDDTAREISLSGEGLNQLYLLFGAPGTGKSYLLKRLLERLGGPQWELPWGGLLLDPKQTLIRDVKGTIPPDRLHIIGPGGSPHTNILLSHLPPQDLGVALAMAAQSAGISTQEPYWINELKRLFGAGLSLLALLDHPLTLHGLAQLFLGRSKSGAQSDHLTLELGHAYEQPLDDAGARRRDRAVNELTQFTAMKGDNADTVRSFVGQVLSPFLDPDLDYVSDSTTRDSLADLIFRDGKWVMLEVPKSALSVSRMLSTLAKVLFQRAALDRDTVFPDQGNRRVFLFVDEYAEVASDLPGEAFGDSLFFSQMRQFKILSLLATQGTTMLDASPVKESWKTMLSNSAGKLLFRLADPDSAELGTKLLGEADIVVSDYGFVQAADGGNVQLGRKLDRKTAYTTDLFLTGLKRGELVFIGTLDGRSRAEARFVKVS
jgi:hypothetical protein